MLEFVNSIGRYCLGEFFGSRVGLELPRARNFTLATGSLVLGEVLGVLLYVWCWFDLRCEMGCLTAFVWIPAGVTIFVFLLEGIRRKIQKAP